MGTASDVTVGMRSHQASTVKTTKFLVELPLPVAAFLFLFTFLTARFGPIPQLFSGILKISGQTVAAPLLLVKFRYLEKVFSGNKRHRRSSRRCTRMVMVVATQTSSAPSDAAEFVGNGLWYVFAGVDGFVDNLIKLFDADERFLWVFTSGR